MDYSKEQLENMNIRKLQKIAKGMDLKPYSKECKLKASLIKCILKAEKKRKSSTREKKRKSSSRESKSSSREKRVFYILMVSNSDLTNVTFSFDKKKLYKNVKKHLKEINVDREEIKRFKETGNIETDFYCARLSMVSYDDLENMELAVSNPRE